MKRILSASVAVLMCMFVFAACDAVPGEVHTPPSVAPVKDVALSDLLDEINAQHFDSGENMKLIESVDKLELYYGIDPADVEEFAAEVSKNSATEIDEVVLIKTTDYDAAKRVAEKLELRLQSQKDLCASYSPELLAIAEECYVKTDGPDFNYVSLIVTEDYLDVYALYSSLLYDL